MRLRATLAGLLVAVVVGAVAVQAAQPRRALEIPAAAAVCRRRRRR
ncbi:hypothetical protein [Nocardioides sp. Kera G14]|nr:hypothetical protein [Nocardioides sp. Kera G14]UDY22995.1 hypothetical protein LH076_13100 [Nocardioides sp. Kera G14]